jgi:hypothetical protein
MRERGSRIGSAIAVGLQAACKRNPTIAGELAQVVELESEPSTVESDEGKVASLGSLPDPARRPSESTGCLLEIEQMPRLSGRRRWKLGRELEREPRR